MMQYLDEVFPGRPLMPPDGKGRAQLRLVATRLRSLDVHTEPAKPEARRRSEPALRTLEVLLQDGRAYLHGADPGHVDALIWPFLANIKVRGLLREPALPNVAAYMNRVAARPSFATTAPPWAQELIG